MLEEENEDGDDVGWSLQLEGLDPCSIWGFPEAASSSRDGQMKWSEKSFAIFTFTF